MQWSELLFLNSGLFIFKCFISHFSVRMSIRYAEERGYGSMVDGVWQPMKQTIKYPDLIVLPSVFQKKLRGHITHVRTTFYLVCSFPLLYFWFFFS